jgi:hypothetical protein
MARIAAVPTAFAMTAAPTALWSRAEASVPTTIHLSPGQVANLDGTQAKIGDTIGHLPTVPGGCDVTEPIGVMYAARSDGMSVTLDIDNACNVVISSITNSAADIADDLNGTLDVSPGAGVPPLPETTDDAVPDPGFLTTRDLDFAQGIVTCKHQGWSKSTVLQKEVGWWMTVAETRNQSNWASTGYRNECYGRSVSNMVVNTSSKYSYCYTADWEYINNYGCWYKVKKAAPQESWSDVYGRYLLYKNYFTLHAWVYTDTSTPYLGNCFITDGTLPKDSRLDCHGRQDF